MLGEINSVILNTRTGHIFFSGKDPIILWLHACMKCLIKSHINFNPSFILADLILHSSDKNPTTYNAIFFV